MSNHSRTNRHHVTPRLRARLTATVAMIAGIVAAVVTWGPAPSAFAYYDVTAQGQRGIYWVEAEGIHPVPTMIAAKTQLLDPLEGAGPQVYRTAFRANGVHVEATLAGAVSVKQTVTVKYVLQRAEATDGAQWTTVAQLAESVAVDYYGSAHVDGATFDDVPVVGGKYRTQYVITWVQDAGPQLAQTMVFPDGENTLCAVASGCYQYPGYIVLLNP